MFSSLAHRLLHLSTLQMYRYSVLIVYAHIEYQSSVVGPYDRFCLQGHFMYGDVSCCMYLKTALQKRISFGAVLYLLKTYSLPYW